MEPEIVGEGETTYVSPTNQPTDQQQPPQSEVFNDYLSVRVTVLHKDVTKLICDVFESLDYILYKHKGTRTHKEHVHVLVTDVSASEKIRNRLKRAGYKGNEIFSIKTFHNGLSKGIQYASKEGTEPTYVGEFEEIIKNAPKWVQHKVDEYTERVPADYKKLRDWQLTYTNIVPVTVRYVQDKRLTRLSFREAVNHLMENTNWRISFKIQQCGIGPFQFSDYDRRLGKVTRFDQSFWENWRV